MSDNQLNNRPKTIYSLSHLTLIACSTPELIYIASRTGYDAISPRLIPIGIAEENKFLKPTKKMIEATRFALKTTGIKVHDMELLRITDDFNIDDFKYAMEIGAKLGANKLITSAWTKEKNREFILEKYVQICELGQQYNMTISLEFPTFSSIKTLKEALELVKTSKMNNARILIDTLYTHMSKTSIEELKNISSKYFDFIQVCDVAKKIPKTIEGMLKIARENRLYLGEGCIDFFEILNNLPAVNYSIELPNDNRVKELGFEEHARRSLQSTKSLLYNKIYKN